MNYSLLVFLLFAIAGVVAPLTLLYDEEVDHE